MTDLSGGCEIRAPVDGNGMGKFETKICDMDDGTDFDGWNFMRAWEQKWMAHTGHIFDGTNGVALLMGRTNGWI